MLFNHKTLLISKMLIQDNLVLNINWEIIYLIEVKRLLIKDKECKLKMSIDLLVFQINKS
jgi:hypothetical protein